MGKVVRAVKVVKTPLAQGQHRNILSRCLGYEFFVQQPDSSHFDVLDPDGKDYEQRLSRLAQDIAHILRTIESAPAAKTSKATVYLAESSSDLKDERRRVLDELVAQGYRVLPEAPLPEHVSDIRREVEAALRQSALAIHLTGPRYGKRPEGTDESIVALQYELARRGGLQRVVWVATKPEETEAPQAAFLEALRAGLDQRVDLLEHKTMRGPQGRDPGPARAPPAGAGPARGGGRYLPDSISSAIRRTTRSTPRPGRRWPCATSSSTRASRSSCRSRARPRPKAARRTIGASSRSAMPWCCTGDWRRRPGSRSSYRS